MSGADGFLARWSRRKLEPDGTADPDVAPVSDDGQAGVGDVEAPLSAEDIAALPRIEELTAETDLTQFLRRGVPALLRQQALRRMWSLDPAIRDFVGEARDYSYDWNVPGGVPVSGPLGPGDDAEATLSRMFSRLRADIQEDDDEPRDNGGVPSDRSAPDQVARATAEEDRPPLSHSDQPDAVSTAEDDEKRQAALIEAAAHPPPPTAADARSGEPRRSRRHGSAIPKFESF